MTPGTQNRPIRAQRADLVYGISCAQDGAPTDVPGSGARDTEVAV